MGTCQLSAVSESSFRPFSLPYSCDGIVCFSCSPIRYITSRRVGVTVLPVARISPQRYIRTLIPVVLVDAAEKGSLPFTAIVGGHFQYSHMTSAVGVGRQTYRHSEALQSSAPTRRHHACLTWSAQGPTERSCIVLYRMCEVRSSETSGSRCNGF